jgi:hypothetical protein
MLTWWSPVVHGESPSGFELREADYLELLEKSSYAEDRVRPC